jgi:hypothetical protein
MIAAGAPIRIPLGMTIEEALDRVAAHLGSSKRAEHSIFVGDVMRLLAERLGAGAVLWEATGLCHDLDFFSTTDDRRQHGIVSAAWLASDLPDDALEAIRSHDHRTGIPADTPIADALKLADALAIADETIGRDAILALLGSEDEAGLRSAFASRPHLPAMIVNYAAKLCLPLSELATICRKAPAQ